MTTLKEPITITLPVTRRRALLAVCGLPALLPIVFMSRSIVVYSTSTMHQTGNDVLGSGGMLLLMATLAITPLALLTGYRWFTPLRQWYGIVFALTIILDAVIAATDSSFAGGVAGRLAGHTFLLLGFTMVLTSLPLLATANRVSMRGLGKYWKPVQRGTYVIWALLFVHLALLEGFGIAHGDPVGPDRFPFDVIHQRLYQLAAISAPLLLLRLPPVRRWVKSRQRAGKSWQVWCALAPLFAVALVAYGFLANELVYKGIAAFNLNPVND